MSDQDTILQFLRTNGPVLPSKIAKLLNTQILLASAHLSDLVAQGKLKVSHLKIGGSPLYYLPGQEPQLYPFAAGNINPKDMQVLERLRSEKVLRESTLDLLAKVALRSLQDFAVPLQVSHQQGAELFWKWHLLTPDETNYSISALLSEKTIVPPPEPAPLPLAPAAPITSPEHKEAQQKLTAPEIAPTLSTPTHPPATSLSPSPVLDPMLSEETEEAEEEELIPSAEEKKPFLQKMKDKITRRKKAPLEDTFLPNIEHFCKKLKIEIEQKETLRKNAEINCVVKVPTVVGHMRYYCKAKNKSRCDEKDLSTAYMEAQIKKLPLLFLYTEEISKKAQEMLESGAFENVIIRKLD